jgi:hypothetical protein
MVVAAPFEQVTRAAATHCRCRSMLFYMVLLDLVGPHTVFSLTNGCRALVWRTRDAVMTSTLPIGTNCGLFRMSQGPDVLFVPGGLKGSLRA